MLDAFDYATYRGILRWAGRERRFLSFDAAAVAGDEPYCLLRHDIDFWLPAALAMARVEADLGAKATYFLLLSACDYNLLAPENEGVASELVGLGHEVGLHYDTLACGGRTGREAIEFFELQAELLGGLTGVPVTVIARHNPGFGGPDPMAGCGRFIDAYDARFTRDIPYISDSCGAWRDAAVAVLAAPEPPRRMQLLVHPVFWSEHGGDRWARLASLRAAQEAAAALRFEHLRAVWLAHAGVAEHDRRAATT